MFRLKQKVKILSSLKTTGEYNFGKIVGMELKQNAYYLGHKNEKEFFQRFDGNIIQYTVAYIDCVSARAHVDYFYGSELSKI